MVKKRGKPKAKFTSKKVKKAKAPKKAKQQPSKKELRAEAIKWVKSIKPKELLNSNNKSILILDIRNKNKFDEWHIQGSQNIDVYNDIWAGNFEDVRKKLSKLPKDKEIITICNAGITAQPASLILESMGYRTKVLENGMIGWNELSLQFKQKDVS